MAERLPVLVSSPWYPSEDLPFAGAFVAQAVQAVLPLVGDVTVVHTKERVYGDGVEAVDRRRAQWLELTASRLRPVPDPAAPGATLRRVEALVPSPSTFVATARAHRDALRTATGTHGPTAWLDVPVVHAHVGTLDGWAAATTVHPDTRLVLSEHYSKLRRVWATLDGRAVYREALLRADAVTVPSEFLAAQLRGAFPWVSDKLVSVGNVVDVDAVAMRPSPVQAVDRWLFLGRLTTQKRVSAVLEAFAVFARSHPRATLTFAGGGPEEAVLRARAAELGLAGAVEVLGPVPPAEVPMVLHAHDVLVHLSSVETFGITVAEALASGMPVVVTRCGGPEEILGGAPAGAGTLVPLDATPDAVAAAVTALEPVLAERDAEAARASIVARYSPGAMGARLLALYQGDAGDPTEVAT